MYIVCIHWTYCIFYLRLAIINCAYMRPHYNMYPKIDVMHWPEIRGDPKQFVKSSFVKILLSGPSNETHNREENVLQNTEKWVLQYFAIFDYVIHLKLYYIFKPFYAFFFHLTWTLCLRVHSSTTDSSRLEKTMALLWKIMFSATVMLIISWRILKNHITL